MSNALVMTESPIYFSLVIPVFNEYDCIDEVISEAYGVFEANKVSSYEIIIVNDGSTDGTKEVLDRMALNNNHVRIIHHESNMGIGAANQSGFRAARGEWVGWIPGDGQFLTTDLFKIFKENMSSELIVANISSKTRVKTDGLFRLIMSRSLRLLMKLIIGTSGNTTGIYLFKRSLLNSINFSISTGLFNIVFPYVIQQQGYCVRYTSIDLYPRRTGVSKVSNKRTIMKILVEMVKFRRNHLTSATTKKSIPQLNG